MTAKYYNHFGTTVSSRFPMRPAIVPTIAPVFPNPAFADSILAEAPEQVLCDGH
jgi:hypothetical protein